MTPRFTAIARAAAYSPHHETNDAAIIRLTREAIEARGYPTELIAEDDLPRATIGAPVVFHMCQGPASLPWLRRLERQGRLVINAAQSVANCYRTAVTPLFAARGIPYPRTVVVGTDARSLPPGLAGLETLWVKRGDVHAMQAGDVARVAAPDVLDALGGLRRRGIERAVLQEHVAGDVVKFYAIRGDGFFEFLHAEGPATRPFDRVALQRLAERAAGAAGLTIYGGDLVIGDHGAIVIDLNDWPSFAPFREQAAVMIAAHIIEEARAHAAVP